MSESTFTVSTKDLITFRTLAMRLAGAKNGRGKWPDQSALLHFITNTNPTALEFCIDAGLREKRRKARAA